MAVSQMNSFAKRFRVTATLESQGSEVAGRVLHETAALNAHAHKQLLEPSDSSSQRRAASYQGTDVGIGVVSTVDSGCICGAGATGGQEGVCAAGGVASTVANPNPCCVILNPNLREKRNLGGQDSNGKWFGEALRQGVREQTKKLYSDSAVEADALCDIKMDLEQARARETASRHDTASHAALTRCRPNPHISASGPC
eukprot:2083590-Pleurochrysis_carterae.AAC.1